MRESTHKFVNDLGVAAYLLMHGFNVVGKKDRSFYFECQSDSECVEFDRLVLEYQPPNQFYTFDSCLMFLKKINEQLSVTINPSVHKTVNDLGVSAYLLMQEYHRDKPLGVKVVGKKGKSIYFEHPLGADDEFERMKFQYLASPFQNYDSNLMALKKIAEMMPGK